MGKRERKSASNKRFEALMRTQKINRILQSGNIQSQALLDSAGETRPSDESHVDELLEHDRFASAETSRIARRRMPGRARPAKAKTQRKKRR